MSDKAIAKPGDVLLYFVDGVVDLVIAEKTGKRVGHIEVYIGDGQSLASRNGLGVNQYPLRLDGLICIRRPKNQTFDLAKGIAWFNSTAKGMKYDFKGLLTFTSFVKAGEPGAMFCSEFALNFFRACGYEPFNPSQLAVNTSPRDFWISSEFDTTFKETDEY